MRRWLPFLVVTAWLGCECGPCADCCRATCASDADCVAGDFCQNPDGCSTCEHIVDAGR